jgi:hypothetical protein
MGDTGQQHMQQREPVWVDADTLNAAIDEWLVEQWRKDNISGAALFARFCKDFRFLHEHIPARAHDVHALQTQRNRVLGSHGGAQLRQRLQRHSEHVNQVHQRLRVCYDHVPATTTDGLLVDWMRNRQDNYVVVSKAHETRDAHRIDELQERTCGQLTEDNNEATSTPSRYDLRVREELHEYKQRDKHLFTLKHDAANKQKVRDLIVHGHVSFERAPYIIQLVVSMFTDDERHLENAAKSIPKPSTIRNWDDELAIAERIQLREEMREVEVVHVSSDASEKGGEKVYAVNATFCNQDGPQRRLLSAMPVPNEQATTLAQRVRDVLNDAGVFCLFCQICIFKQITIHSCINIAKFDVNTIRC